MPLWNGALLAWSVEYDPILTANNGVGGSPRPEICCYPMRDLDSLKQLVNFIPGTALTTENFLNGRLEQAGNLDDFAPRFDDWVLTGSTSQFTLLQERPVSHG